MASPDTMMAGNYAKNIELKIFTMPELWSDVAEKQTAIKTIYSFISSKILYYFYEN